VILSGALLALGIDAHDPIGQILALVRFHPKRPTATRGQDCGTDEHHESHRAS